MDIDDEDDNFRSTSVKHSLLTGGALVREVRWFSESGRAYRWSESGDRWVYLGRADGLNDAKHLAATIGTVARKTNGAWFRAKFIATRRMISKHLFKGTWVRNAPYAVKDRSNPLKSQQMRPPPSAP
jgi:hypothetical protein